MVSMLTLIAKDSGTGFAAPNENWEEIC